MMKKKWLLVVLFVLSGLLGACGNSSEKSTSNKESDNTDREWAEIEEAEKSL